MKHPLVIVSGLFPPLRGGLADHTANLARELSSRFSVRVLTSRGAGEGEGFAVDAVISDWGDAAFLEGQICRSPPRAVVVWQYVPHMYGRGGANRRLPLLWNRLKRAGYRQVMVTHEIAADLTWRPHWLWYALHHRWQWNRLMRTADSIPISTERWLEEWSRRRPEIAPKFFLSPSPASMSPIPVDSEHKKEWRLSQGLPTNARIILYFGTVNTTKRLDWVLEAWAKSHSPEAPVAFCVVGDKPRRVALAGPEPLFRPLGFLNSMEASRALLAADVLAVPFLDGASERRSSLMTGLAHGLATVTTVGHNTGSSLRRSDFLLLSSAHDRRWFTANVMELLRDDSRRMDLARKGFEVYEREYSWRIVANRLARAIEGLIVR